MKELIDTEFTHAVRAAAKGRGAALAAILETRSELSRAEITLLTELHLGDLNPAPGRPRVLPWRRWEIMGELYRLVEAGEKKEAAKVAVAAKYAISVRTVESYDKHLKIKVK